MEQNKSFSRLSKLTDSGNTLTADVKTTESEDKTSIFPAFQVTDQGLSLIKDLTKFSAVTENSNENDEDDIDEDDIDEMPIEREELISSFAKQAQGLDDEDELKDLVDKIYQTGYDDAMSAIEGNDETEMKETIIKTLRKNLDVTEASFHAGESMTFSFGINKEDDAGWVAVEIAKAGITVDMEEALGIFYFNFKNKADADKARKIAEKLEVEIV